MIIDKKGILSRISEMNYVALDLGCGPIRRGENFIGIDIIDLEEVDLVGEIFEVLASIPNDSVDFVFSNQFFEHVADITKLLSETARILKKGARSEIIVPHFSNPYYYSDYTHRSFFGLYSMSYFMEDKIFKRKVPNYGVEIKFKLVKAQIRFRSPFYLTYPHRWLLTKLINISNFSKELYEQNFCYLLPCNDVRFIIEKL